MGYQLRPQFDQPTAEEMQRSRSTMLALLPVFLLQQGLRLVDDDGNAVRQLLYVASWSAVSLLFVSVLAGWKLPFTSLSDQMMFKGEWTTAARGDAMRYGIGALVVVGAIMMASTIWMEVASRTAINVLVGVPLAVAGARFAWLNRGEPTDDE